MESLRETLALLEAEGLTLPSPAYLLAVLLFGVIGLVLFVMARRRRKRMVKWVAVALMLYPYLVWGTMPVWIVGVSLCALAAWCWRQPG
ncbi:MAG: hypothetical protein ABIQ86_09475 [Steroidobacteraceae bacterium]